MLRWPQTNHNVLQVLRLPRNFAEGTATFETYLGQRPGRRP